MTGSVVFSNTTYGQGGGLVNQLELYLTSSRVYQNSSASNGGGLSSDGLLEVHSSQIYSNTGLAGGGIEAYGLVTLTHSSLHDNIAADSGGGAFMSVSVPSADRIVMTDVDVYANQVIGPGEGGGLELQGGGLGATLTRVRIFDNHVVSSTIAQGGGGLAIIYYGLVTLRDSAIFSNTASHGSGGGIYLTNGAGLDVVNSAIYGNSASRDGGGLYSQYIPIALTNYLSLTNSTVSGNSALQGGGLYAAPGNDPARLDFTTIFGNIGINGVNLNGPATVHGSVIGGVILPCAGEGQVFCGGAVVAGPYGQNCLGVVVSAGYNIDDDGTCNLVGAGDLSDAAFTVGPLAWNGGPTLTHAALAGSPLIDTADPGNCPPTDQRGGVRPVDGDGAGGARCDKGAYERLAIVARYYLPIILR